MSDNVPVSTLSAALTLDVAGFASGVKQAEALSRRLAKAQQDALGGPAVRRSADDGLVQQVIRAQELRARSLASPDLQGPMRLRSGTIDAEISVEMGKRIAAAQRRVEVERQTEDLIKDNRARNAQAMFSEESAFAEQMASVREESARRVALRESAWTEAQDSAREQASQATRQRAAEEAQSYRTTSQIADARWAHEIEMIERTRRASTTLFEQVTGPRSAQLPTADTSAFNTLSPNFERMTSQAQRAEYALRSIGTTSQDSQRASARFGLIMQQAGYQMQDFSVQVAGGTNVLVAFSQQSSQMLGFFGPGGAIAGAVIATGVLAARLVGLSLAAKENASAADEARDSWAKYSETVKGVRFQGMDTQAQIGDLNSQEDRARKAQDEMVKLQSRLGNLSAGFANDYFGTAISGIKEYDSWIFPTLEKQLEYERAILKVKTEGTAMPSREDLVNAGGIDVRNPLSGVGRVKSILGELDKATAASAIKIVEIIGKRGELEKRIGKEREAEARRQQAEEERRFEELKTARKDIMGSLYGKPLVDEKMLGELVQAGALTQKQADLYRSIAQAQKMRSESDLTAGKTNAQQVTILQRQADLLDKIGAGKSEFAQTVDKELRSARRAAEEEAKGYLDQLDPLRKKRRELENIRDLQNQGFLPDGSYDRFVSRFIDEARRSLKIPDQFTFSGASSSGGMTGDASGASILETSRKMLEALNKIVDYSALMAGNN